MQSIDRGTGLWVCDPRTFGDYRPVKLDELIGPRVRKMQVLVIVNKVDDVLPEIFRVPVINAQNLTGNQLVLSDKRYTHVIRSCK